MGLRDGAAMINGKDPRVKDLWDVESISNAWIVPGGLSRDVSVSEQGHRVPDPFAKRMGWFMATVIVTGTVLAALILLTGWVFT